MHRMLWGLILIGFFSLCACTVSLPHREQTKNLIPPPSVAHETHKALQKKSIFTQGQWPKAKWWEVYHSPQLNQIVETALEYNPSLQEVRARIEVARQRAIIARSTLFPLIFFNAEDTKLYASKNGLYRALNPTFPINGNLADLSLSFDYEFDFWGQNHNLFYAALGREQANIAEAAQVELITTTSITQAYFALKTNLVRRALYLQLAHIRQKTLHDQHVLLNNGLNSALIPLNSAESYDETRKLVASIDEEIAVDKHTINVLAGRSPDCPLAITASLPPLPKKIIIPPCISLDLLSRRPDLMAQIWRAKALAFEVGAAKADFYPNINIKGLVGLETTKLSQLFDASSFTWHVKPALHLPLFTAGAIKANVRATKASFDEAIFAYNNLLLKSAQEVLDNIAFANSVYTQQQTQQHIINDAVARYRLTIVLKDKGLDSIFQNYYLQDQLIQRRLENIALIYNQYLATIKLTRALGGGYVQDYVPLRNVPCTI